MAGTLGWHNNTLQFTHNHCQESPGKCVMDAIQVKLCIHNFKQLSCLKLLSGTVQLISGTVQLISGTVQLGSETRSV